MSETVNAKANNAKKNNFDAWMILFIVVVIIIIVGIVGCPLSFVNLA